MKAGNLILIISFLIVAALLLVNQPASASATSPDLAMAGMGTGMQTPALKIDDRMPDLVVDAYYNGNISKINFGDYRGKWLVFIFYPADFTFVCPTELEEMASLYANFTALGAEVFSVSRDTAYVHKAWHESDPRIKKIRFPMIADTTGNLCRTFGTYNESDGLSLRGSFIFDPDGRLKVIEIHDNSFGRNSKELLRMLKAAKFVRESNGKVCPASWEEGEEAIQPS